MAPRTEVAIDMRGDIYLMRRRPGHAQVLVNDGYEGLLALDPWTGSVARRARFPRGFRESGGAVAELFASADGQRALVRAEAPAHGEAAPSALLALDADETWDLPDPGWAPSAAHAWDADGLVCADERGERFASLDGTDVWVAAPSLAVRAARPGWRRALHEHVFPDGAVRRTYNDEASLLITRRAHGRPRLTRVSWPDGDAFSTPAPVDMDDAAALPDDLFSVARNLVWRHPRGTEPTVFWEPDPEWEVRGVETLTAHPPQPAAVILLLRHRVDLLARRLTLLPVEPASREAA